jgi:hypothetical protein
MIPSNENERNDMQKAISRYWIPLIVLALALRLVSLNAVPLAPGEAALALPAWQVSTGGDWPLSTESPLLLNGNVLLFTLLPATDAIARLLPLLCGMGLVLVPLLWRKRLGDGGALIAGGLLALSPIALFASRHLDGAVVGALGATLIVTVLFQKLGAGWLAAGVILGLTGGPVFFDTLLPALLAWLITQRLERTYPQPSVPTLRRGLFIGVLGAALVAIAGGFHWSGWSGVGDGLMAWLRGWRSNATPPANIALLLLYEPLTFLLASIGLVRSNRERSPLGLTLGLWTLLAGVLVLLRPGATALSLITLVIPLALLAGRTADRLIARTQKHRGFILLQGGLSLVFWLFGVSIVIRQVSPELRSGMEFVLLLLVFTVQALLTAGFATLLTSKAAWRGVLIGGVAALLLLQVGFGWGVAILRADDPHEPLVGPAASRDLRNLRRLIDDLRLAQGASPETFEIVLVEGPVLTTTTVHWALHDLPNVRVVDGWPASSPDLIITPDPYSGVETGGERLQGTSFVAVQRLGNGAFSPCSQALPPVCADGLAWYFYRDNPIPLRESRVLLWTDTTP